MKRLIMMSLLIGCFHTQAKHRKICLQDALDLKLIKAKAYSLGEYQGSCMTIKIKNLTKDSLIILIEAGRKLNSLDDNYQDILIVKEELLGLRLSEEKSIKIKGYCCQASNRGPFSGLEYGLNKLADTNLVKLANYLNVNSFNQTTEQTAVWAISDNRVTASITEINDSIALPLRQMVASIKREPIPWYKLLTKNFQYSTGQISNYPISLRGKLEYSNEKLNYATLIIVNNKGIWTGQIKSFWLDPSIKNELDLNVSLKGFAKGKYSIQLITNEKQLASKNFEI